jgi:hypothetical protein
VTLKEEENPKILMKRKKSKSLKVHLARHPQAHHQVLPLKRRRREEEKRKILGDETDQGKKIIIKETEMIGIEMTDAEMIDKKMIDKRMKDKKKIDTEIIDTYKVRDETKENSVMRWMREKEGNLVMQIREEREVSQVEKKRDVRKREREAEVMTEEGKIDMKKKSKEKKKIRKNPSWVEYTKEMSPESTILEHLSL